jgi:hypothetical protein
MHTNSAKVLIPRETNPWAQGVVGSNPIAPTNNYLLGLLENPNFCRKTLISTRQQGLGNEVAGITPARGLHPARWTESSRRPT